MNDWEKHYRSIQKKNKKSINPPLPNINVRGIPPRNELEQLLKNRVRIDPKIEDHRA
jgi:hypothetical protein